MSEARVNGASALQKATYPNLRSRLLLGGLFERQYSIPEDPPWLFEHTGMFIERWLLSVDLSDIVVDRPVFLLGLPRSGTTMVQDLCCTHPELAYITNAMHQFPRCFCGIEKLRKWLHLDVSGERYLGDSVPVSVGSPNEGIQFWAKWFHWDACSPEYHPRAPEDYSAQEIADLHALIRRVIWCFGKPWRRFFSKNPAAVTDLERLHHFFPDGRFIHIVRDPRSCANSMRKHYKLEQQQLNRVRSAKHRRMLGENEFIPYPRVAKLPEYLCTWGPDNVRTTAHVWNDCLNMVNAVKDRVNHFLEIRYEDVVAEPQRRMAEIFEFCQLDYPDASNTEFHTKLAAVGRIHHQNRYSDFDVIEQICAPEMQRLGYTDSLDSAVIAPALEQQAST